MNLVMQERVKIGLIGVGRAGGALTEAFYRAGYPIISLFSRNSGAIAHLAGRVGAFLADTPDIVAQSADLVFITTPDAAIAPMCERIAAARGWRADQGVVHCSGAVGRNALESAARFGAFTGGFHPLQTLSGLESADRLRGAYIALEADPPLADRLHALAIAVGALPFALDGQQRALYHTAAVIVANFTVTLYACAGKLFSTAQLPDDVRLRALLPLLRGAVASLERGTPAEALTGPYARGDTPTVERHLAALAASAPDILPLYRAMGLATLNLARERGLPEETIEMLARLLDGPSPESNRPVTI